MSTYAQLKSHTHTSVLLGTYKAYRMYHTLAVYVVVSLWPWYQSCGACPKEAVTDCVATIAGGRTHAFGYMIVDHGRKL